MTPTIEIKISADEVLKVQDYSFVRDPFVDIRIFRGGKLTPNGISLKSNLVLELIKALEKTINSKDGA